MLTAVLEVEKVKTDYRFRQIKWVTAFVFSFTIILSSCMPISAFFSSTAYEQATALKAEALTIMELASEDFSDHKSDVDAFKLNINKAIEFAKGRPRNEITVRQWEVLMDPNRNSLGGFLVRWESESTLTSVFVTEAKLLIADAFDQIIGLESGKIKQSDIN